GGGAEKRGGGGREREKERRRSGTDDDRVEHISAIVVEPGVLSHTEWPGRQPAGPLIVEIARRASGWSGASSKMRRYSWRASARWPVRAYARARARRASMFPGSRSTTARHSVMAC